MRTPVASSPRRASTEPKPSIGAAFAHAGRVALLGLVLLLGGALSAAPAKWDPVDPADMASTASASSPGADVEYLLSANRLHESGYDSLLDQEVRAKIYTAKGVSEQGKIGIVFPDGAKIDGLRARLLKPDGTSIELTKADIYETVLAKVGVEKMKRWSFVFPNLAPGDIVEYRWTTTIERGSYTRLWFYCQEEFPVREYRFTLGDMSHDNFVYWMNCPNAEQTKNAEGRTLIIRNLPAFVPEEHMPPQREFRSWVLFIRDFAEGDRDDMWKQKSKAWAEEFDSITKPGSVLKAKAAGLVAGAKTDEEKLRRLYDFCQSEITNYSWCNSPEIQAAREKSWNQPFWQSPKRLLERRAGWGNEICNLFAALARAAGYQVRSARSVSKDELLTVRTAQGWTFLDRTCVAVKVGDKWAYFNPGNYFVPADMLYWCDESATMLLCDEKQVVYDTAPVSGCARSEVRRKGRFTLDAEGCLEGTVEESFTGHLAMLRKVDHWQDAQADVDKEFREAITQRLPSAEVSEVAWSNLRTRLQPLTVTYHLRIPGYAEQAGRRIAFAPAVCEAGKPVVFASAERKFPIVFPYSWAEHDDVEIVLPEGYGLDNPSAPAPVGNPAGAFGAFYALKFMPKTRTFCYQRDFALGANGINAFRRDSYATMKALYEQLHKSDTHTVLLKPKELPAAVKPAAATMPPASVGQP